MASCKLMLNFCWWDQLVFLTFSTCPHHFPRFSWFSQCFPDISRFFPVFFWVFFHQKRFFCSARMAPAPWRPPVTLRWMRRWRGWAWGGSCADSWGRSWNWRKMLGITHKSPWNHHEINHEINHKSPIEWEYGAPKIAFSWDIYKWLN